MSNINIISERYINTNTKIVELKKELSELKKQCKEDENIIVNYLEKNNISNVEVNLKKLLLMDKKVSKNPKKQDIIDKLKEELKSIKQIPVNIDNIDTEKLFETETLIEKIIKIK